MYKIEHICVHYSTRPDDFLKFFHHRVFFDFGPAPIIWIKTFKVT